MTEQLLQQPASQAPAESLAEAVAPPWRPSAMMVAAAALLVVAFAAVFGGVWGALAAAVTLLLALALDRWTARPENAADRRLIRRAGEVAYALVPAGLVVYFAFNAGGFFPVSTGFAAALLLLLIALRALLAERPFAGLDRRTAAVAAALGLFAAWTLISGLRGGADGRALVEFERAAMYALGVVLAASAAGGRERTTWAIRGLAAAILAVCTAGLVTRVLPHVWSIAPGIANDRLSYPLTYWNALGLLAGIGIILSFHITTSTRHSAPWRAAAAAALPILGPTLLFTFSRGAIVATAFGLAAYILIGRPRALLPGLMATLPPTAVAVSVAYNADALASATPASAQAVHEGHGVAIAVAGAAAAAVLIRVALLGIDRKLAGLRLPHELRRPVTAGAWAGLAVAVVVTALALDAPSKIGHAAQHFASTDAVAGTADLRQRLTDTGNNYRIESWRVAWNGFKDAPVAGQGAGSFAALWEQKRPITFHVSDAHSLYVEVLDELGVVGFVLLVAALAGLLLSVVSRARRPERSAYAALAAVGVAWIFHAGIDWDWENPAVTVPWLALAATAIASTGVARRRPSWPLRAVITAACVLLAVPAALVSLSSRHVDRAIHAYAAGDCRAAADEAGDARRTLPDLAEAYEIEGLCQVRAGQPGAGAATLGRAVEHEPDNWHFRYAQGLARAAAGQDPTAALRAAHAANPRDSGPVKALAQLGGASAAMRTRRAKVLIGDVGLYEVR